MHAPALALLLAAAAQLPESMFDPDTYKDHGITDASLSKERQRIPIDPGTVHHAVFRAAAEELAEMLLRGVAKTDLDAHEYVWGLTPLLLTVSAPFGDPANRTKAKQKRFDLVASHLLEAGADPNALDLVGKYADRPEVAAKYAELTGCSPIIRASEHGMVTMVKLLLKHGADVDLQDRHGETALIRSARKGHLGVTKLLLAAKADVHLRSEASFTPLLEAAWQGNAAVVKRLLASNASANDANAFGEGALMGAAAAGHVEVVRRLLAHGAEADAPNEDGMRPLRAATTGSGPLEGRMEAIRLLLEHDEVDMEARHRKDGLTALAVAESLGKDTPLAFLIRTERNKRLARKRAKKQAGRAERKGREEL